MNGITSKQSIRVCLCRPSSLHSKTQSTFEQQLALFCLSMQDLPLSSSHSRTSKESSLPHINTFIKIHITATTSTNDDNNKMPSSSPRTPDMSSRAQLRPASPKIFKKVKKVAKSKRWTKMKKASKPNSHDIEIAVLKVGLPSFPQAVNFANELE